MGEQTKIAWTDSTWNPGQGCKKVNLDCRGCYMYRDMPWRGKDPRDIHRSKPYTFNLPLRIKEPGRVFVCSWSDFFLEEHDAWRGEAWDIIRRCQHLTFQIPTKRPERIRQCLPIDWGAGWPNVWLGVSAGHVAAWDKFVPILQAVPAAVRWVSVEPQWEDIIPRPETLRGLAWIVVGGESGGGEAREFREEWARRWLSLSREYGFRVFVKQMGSFWARVHGADRSAAEPAAWPEDLRVRDFPEVRHG